MMVLSLVLSKKRADPGGVYGWHFGTTTAETRVAVVVLAPHSAERAYEETVSRCCQGRLRFVC